MVPPIARRSHSGADGAGRRLGCSMDRHSAFFRRDRNRWDRWDTQSEHGKRLDCA
jgi:hypothetical protein